MSTSVYHISNTKMAEELELIEKAKQDPSKFSLVYERYYSQIMKFVRYRTEDASDAEDIVHQVFLKAIVNLKKFMYQGVPFVSWLYRIALSEVNDFYRRSKKERVVHARSEQIYSMLEQVDEEVASDQFTLMIKALEKLSEEDLQLIEMRFFEKMAFKEVAEVAGITENHAKVKVYRILEKMKKFVSKI